MNKEPINILYSSLSGEIIGGGQHSLLLLLERLDRTRFCPFLICPTPGEVIDRANAMGIETAVVPMPPLRMFLPSLLQKTSNTEHRTSNIEQEIQSQKLKTQDSKPSPSSSPWTTLRSLIRFIRAHNIHLIHSDTPRQAFYLGVAGMICRIPMIWHIRTSERQNRLFDRLLFAMSRRVIPVSRAAASRFQNLPGQQKIKIIYNGIDVDNYTRNTEVDKIRNEFAPNGELLIGTAGQLVPEKGIETFLEAAALVLSRRSLCATTNASPSPTPDESHSVGRIFQMSRQEKNIRFLVIGRGTDEYTAYLHKIAADLGIANFVIFTGFRRDIPEIMAALDIFVLATKAAEGLSRVILEAMACSIPVVTTDIGGNPELVVDGKTGILVQTDNPETFATALVELIGNEQQRKAIGTRGRERAKSEFDLTATINAIEHIYEELL